MSSLGRAFARFAGFVSAATALTVFFATGSPSWADDPHFHAAPASAREQRNPHTDDNAIRTGQTSFAKNCAACHGADARGTGNVPALTSNEVKQAADGELFWYITHGEPNNGMPSWAQLPEEERWDVVAFLRALAEGKAKAAAPAASSASATHFDAPMPSAPFTDFRAESPGTSRKITPQDLPAPYATKSANNGPKLVPKPDSVWPKAPPGFRVQRYASGVDAPRLIRVAPNGDAFVALNRAGKVQVFRGTTQDGSAATSSVFLEGLKQPFGIAFYPPGPQPHWVYIGNTDEVVRVAYRDGDLVAGAKPEHVADLPAGGGHSTRDIAFSPDGKTMYVSVGSRSNVDDPDTTPGEKNRADILAFNPDGSGQRIFAAGIRNAVGIAVQPDTGDLWCSVNERDGLGDNLVPDYITHVRDGGFYGWPWWYIGPHQDPRHAGKHPELKDKTLVPDVLLQPHSASLELAFYTGTQFPTQYRGDIFAAEHGSWNKSIRAGYEVIRVPLHQSHRAGGEYEDFLTGFVLDSGDAWGRPVGVAVAQDGSLLVTDDGSGSIWRVSYTGEAAAK
jgi:glucose/arabinose dehydrogenase